MGVIEKHSYGVTSDMIKDFLVGWDTYWMREGLMRKGKISCLVAAVVIVFCGGFRVEEVFLASLKEMLKFWEET